MKTYWYCGIKVKGIHKDYWYISDLGALQIGTYAQVPFGSANHLQIGIVTSCAEYTAETAPYPLGSTKHILRVAAEEEYNNQTPVKPFFSFDDDDNDDDDDEIYEADAWILSKNWTEVLAWACDHHETTSASVMEKVVECYELCVEQGMAVAALNLGTLYYTGRFVEQDYRRAFQLYKIAADQGNIQGICNCGYCYYYGRHSKIDYPEAFKYFALGALLHDDANCLYKLGDMYLNGYAAEKNETFAFHLYTRALKRCQNDEGSAECMADAQYRVGKCLLYGTGCQKDPEEAHTLLCLSLINFYKRRNTDPFAGRLIRNAQELIHKAQEQLDAEMPG